MSVVLVSFIGDDRPEIPAGEGAQLAWGAARLTFSIKPSGGDWAQPLGLEDFALESVEQPEGLPQITEGFREELRRALHRQREGTVDGWLKYFDPEDAPEEWWAMGFPTDILWRG